MCPPKHYEQAKILLCEINYFSRYGVLVWPIKRYFLSVSCHLSYLKNFERKPLKCSALSLPTLYNNILPSYIYSD